MRIAPLVLGTTTLTSVIVAAALPQGPAVQRIDLAERLKAGALKAVNRDVAPLQGTSDAVKVSEREGSGVVWIDGTDFALGTIELDVRGRDVLQRSFLGVAYHRQDDNTYEAVYLRRSTSAPTIPHAINTRSSTSHCRRTTRHDYDRSSRKNSRTRSTRPSRQPTGCLCAWW